MRIWIIGNVQAGLLEPDNDRTEENSLFRPLIIQEPLSALGMPSIGGKGGEVYGRDRRNQCHDQLSPH
jgi:hypothetical protein